ncbi:TspO/MBR family protein [Gracilimonas mengyeensis]|uniref:TspO and MBR related proteins n=1 Tax=Gracilimonas mengyeensis TaxID=1302730 RepID=A0A521D4R8_9BACT|nr:TspO/MBR family protein [Gracilimonas mengyeensis]SMO66665.1 TspO and MBR related proteins [Gracilimonas mengyeensis]
MIIYIFPVLKIPYWLKIVLGIIVCNLVGLLASSVTLPAIEGWYSQLQKPVFNPPNWLFGPVWTTLYTLMGVAAAGIWQVGFQHKAVKHALSIFGIQLALNGIWSFLFFGFQSPLLAFIEILFLLLAILITIKRFSELKAWTAWLLIPYLLWVSFASVLTFSIYWLN